MDITSSQPTHSISVLVEGRNCYLNVTRNTTCGDVIKQLLNSNGMKENEKDSYFLFASNIITEQQLSSKENILNIATNLISETNRVHFIMRKKKRLTLPKLVNTKCRRPRDKTFEKEVEKVESTPLYTSKLAPSMKSKDPMRGEKRLHQLVQVQKRRLSKVYQKLTGTSKCPKLSIEGETVKPKADTSLDQFYTSVNKEHTHGFFSFCDVVTTKQMGYMASVMPTPPCGDRSVMGGHTKLMQSKLDRPRMDYTTENNLLYESTLAELNVTFEDVTNDVLMLDDTLHHRGEDDGSFRIMNLPLSRRLTIADLGRVRWNEKPLHSTPFANKTMTFLKKPIKSTRMMRQFGSSRLPLDRITNLTRKEIPRSDSSLNRRTDGDLSMSICQTRSDFSSKKDQCKYFWEQSYVSDSDDSLKDQTRLHKEIDDAVLNDDMNVSTNSVSSFNVRSKKLANEHAHLMLAYNRRPSEFLHENDVQKAHDSLIKTKLKSKLVNYSVSDLDISSVLCESAEISRDCK
ncbi:hypothetical protein ACJMK2_020695 [Sinanodonta woodiana]|uniref:Ras-associating domain-containing protein n=1 Tax=Sinanodonta woodiana TaxID=1069815 RepID=A0ABD3U2T4_SINWO